MRMAKVSIPLEAAKVRIKKGNHRFTSGAGRIARNI
jgi:hypothetical protein